MIYIAFDTGEELTTWQQIQKNTSAASTCYVFHIQVCNPMKKVLLTTKSLIIITTDPCTVTQNHTSEGRALCNH